MKTKIKRNLRFRKNRRTMARVDAVFGYNNYCIDRQLARAEG